MIKKDLSLGCKDNLTDAGKVFDKIWHLFMAKSFHTRLFLSLPLT
jgi:hypothetical protein